MKTLFEVFPPSMFRNSTVAIVFDAYSSAWQILFLLLKEAIERDYFAVISNYSVPLRSLIHRCNSVGLDAKRALEDSKMAIIDVFDSRYSSSRAEMKNVFYLDKVEPETINPKVDRIYCGPLRENLMTKNSIRVIYTLDGASMMFGEDQTLKLLNQTIASKSISFPESTLLLPLNEDIVSRRFVAWVSNVSDYVILAKSWIIEDRVRELLYFLKAPYADFEPVVYSLKVSREREKIMLERLSPPELGPSGEEQR